MTRDTFWGVALLMTLSSGPVEAQPATGVRTTTLANCNALSPGRQDSTGEWLRSSCRMCVEIKGTFNQIRGESWCEDKEKRTLYFTPQDCPHAGVGLVFACGDCISKNKRFRQEGAALICESREIGMPINGVANTAIGDFYQIVNKATGKAINVAGASAANDAFAVVSPKANSDSFRFRFMPGTEGWMYLRPKHSDKTIAIRYGATADNSEIVQWDEINKVNHQWRVDNAGNGHVYIVSKAASTKVLAMAASGDKLIITEKTGAAQQQWKLE